MNAFTYGGFRCGVFTLCGDLLKDFLPVFLYRSGELPENPLMLSFVMAAPVLGHILPFYDIKRGGKGIAATFGCYLGLLPHWIPLCVLAGIFIFFSCVVKINPNYYRTVATYILAAICTGLSGAKPLYRLRLFVDCGFGAREALYECRGKRTL